MKTSPDGIDLIKRFEGCRLTAYADPATHGEPYTIGYGTTSSAGVGKISKGMSITQAQAESMLIRSLEAYEQAVMRALTRPPTQHQFDAMVSLAYNIGPGAFAGSSVAGRFNKGDVPGAADAFLMWNKAGGRVMQGLVNRRADERRLFLTGGGAAAPSAPVPPIPAPVPPAQPETPPAAPPDPGANIAKWVVGFVAALVAVLAGWMIKG